MGNQGKKVALAVLGIAAIGAAAYILLTPGKAAALKQKFAEGADDLACKLGDFFTEAKERIHKSSTAA